MLDVGVDLGSRRKEPTNRDVGDSTRCRKLVIGTWNVRTLQDKDGHDRPQRRTAIVANELKQHNVDIAALSETRFAEEGSLREVGGGYTFYWKGKGNEERRIHGVGFAVRNEIADQMEELPIGINERLMTLRLKLNDYNHVTVISAYAPTLDSDDDIKEKFYFELEEILKNVPDHDKILLLGDFNARVGREKDLWEGIIGGNGVGKVNSNGILLLSLCAKYGLIITNTIFRQKDKFKTSWKHPRSKQWHLLDYIIVRKKNLKDVQITKAAIGSDDCWTDHRMIVSRMNFQLKRNCRKKKTKSKKKFNVSNLEDPNHLLNMRDELDHELRQNQPEENSSIEKEWEKFKAVIIETCSRTIGYVTRRHEDWFDTNNENIQRLLRKKRSKFLLFQANPDDQRKKKGWNNIRAKVQKEIRVMQNKWWEMKSLEIQEYADQHDTKKFFEATRVIYGPSTKGQVPIRTKDGTQLLKDTNSINKRWKEHFETLLNNETTVANETLDQLTQHPIATSMADPPTIIEVKTAIKSMKNNKACGKDNIPAEIYKLGGDYIHAKFHQILLRIWSEEEIPQDFRDASIITLVGKKLMENGNRHG